MFKKLSDRGSIANTKPLMNLIYSFYKRRDDSYKSPTAKLIKQIYFLNRKWVGNKIVISLFKKPRRIEDIVFPKGLFNIIYK